MPRCIACDSPVLRREPFFHIWKGRRFPLLRCGACTHQFVDPGAGPVGREIPVRPQTDGPGVAGRSWLLGQRSYEDAAEGVAREADLLLSLLPGQGRLLLVGAPEATLLRRAAGNGLDVRVLPVGGGPEPPPTVSADAPEEPFDMVTLLDVLEELPDPLATVRRLAGRMSDGATLLVRGFLADDPLVRLREGVRRTVRLPKRLPGPPRRVSCFNRRSLVALLGAAGFRVIHVRSSYLYAHVVAVREDAHPTLQRRTGVVFVQAL